MKTEIIVKEIKEKLKGLSYNEIHNIYVKVMSEISRELIL